MQPQTQRLYLALTDASRRTEAARKLAAHLGADTLIIFVADPEIGIRLPAPGFPQTLPGGKIWQNFLSECVTIGHYSGELPFPKADTLMPAFGVASEDGSVLVLLGAAAKSSNREEINLFLPFLGAAFRGERIALTAAGHAQVAKEAAAQAKVLAAKLSVTRSDLQQALLSAEAAIRAKDEFLATISHELRTPLNAIVGWVNILSRKKLNDEAINHAIEVIQRNTHSQAKLIEDILDVSRIITGKFRLDVRPVDLASIVESAAESLRPAAEAKEIRFDVVIDPKASPVTGDSERLQQIVWNLVSNAIKFTPKKGRVQVHLERVNSHIEITVSDTGQGIAPEFLPYVFERFRQADASSTRMHGGLGLGLAIVRHLVELHGGSVSVHSPGLGQGAAFTVKLPLTIASKKIRGSDEVHPTAEARRSFDCPPSLSNLRVMVVDDEPDSREVLKLILEECGAEVEAAASAKEALRRLEHHFPDVLVSDIGMPGEDGYELIRQVRELAVRRGQRIPAIALTAYSRMEDRTRALSAGYHLHLPKPVEPDELIIAVANLVKHFT
jgi:signal transduction histidine kinase